MAMSISTNPSALNSQRTLNASQGSLQTAMQRLSSGLRVNGAKDDAAGLALADRMNAQVRGSNTALTNANDGLGMMQMADNALGKITESLQRMRELAVRGANGTHNASDYINLDNEWDELTAEITRITDGTRYNDSDDALINNLTVTFQVGANNVAEEKIDVTFNTGDISAATGASVDSQANSQAAIEGIDTALENIGIERAKLGANQNKFESTIAALQSDVEVISGARGRIMDADFAKETSNLSRAQVLQQAGTAMLAQANQSAQNVMQLLR